MTIDVSKHIVKDLGKIIFCDLKTREPITYDGNQIDFDSLPDDIRKYIIRLMYESYHSGAIRCVDLFNRDQERQRRQAQKRAEERLLKGAEKYLKDKGKA